MHSRRYLHCTLVVLLFLLGLLGLQTVRTDAGYLPLADVERYTPTTDGNFVVFSRRITEQSSYYDLFSVSTNGGQSVQLNQKGPLLGGAYTISPDSRWVIFTEDADQPIGWQELVKVPVSGGRSIPLTTGQSIFSPITSEVGTISPDSQYILVELYDASYPTSPRGLFSVSLEDGTRTRLDDATPFESNVVSVLISPDSQWVAFSIHGMPSGGGSYVAPITGGSLVPLGEGATDYRFTDDSEYMVFNSSISQAISATNALVSMEPNGDNLTVLDTNLPELYFQITPDGNQVVYSYALNDSHFENAIYRVPVTGGTPQLLIQDMLGVNTVVRDLTNDYALLRVMDTTEEGNPQTYLDSMRLDGTTAPTRLTQNLGSKGFRNFLFANLSPDGQSLVYSPIRYGGIPLTPFSVPLDGSRPSVQLAMTDTVYGWVFDSDSAYLYLSTTEGERHSIVRIPIEGGDTETLYTVTNPVMGLELYPTEIAPNRVLFRQYLAKSWIQPLYIASTDDSAVQFGASYQLVEELSGTYTSEVELHLASLTTITAQVDVVGGTATGGEDYTFAPLTVTFAPGETSASVPVTILADEEEEGEETIILEISNIEGGIAGEPISQTITIADTVYRWWLPLTTHNR
jgi:Tol biopolymer transport system component